jgi:thiamine biosynthesis lipoprotein
MPKESRGVQLQQRARRNANVAGRRLRARRSAAGLLLVLAFALAGCSSVAQPVRVSRQALGTSVTIEAFGGDEQAVSDAVDAAFDAIAAVQAELDAYDPTSAVAAFNASPFEWHTLPPSAVEILDAVDDLDVGDAFSPALFGVVELYDFGGEGHVPTTGELSAALMTASMPERDGNRMRFAGISSSHAVPGLDFGGAAKGLALDRAREALRSHGAVTAALITAGSTTITLGTKPDDKPWRIGVEDPREPGHVRVVATWTGDAALSTSGDYQQYFEQGGAWYHHILDPATGRPTPGVRSVTVVGRISALESDILSTALFVRGPARAEEAARANGAGLFVIDASDRETLSEPPSDDGVSLSVE